MQAVLRCLLIGSVSFVQTASHADVYVCFMPGADDAERMTNAFSVAVKTHEPIRVGPVLIDRPVRPLPKAGERFFEGVEIVGTGVFSDIRLQGDGEFVFPDSKRVTWRRCGFLRVGDPGGRAVTFEAKESSSSEKVVECAFQGFDTALTFRGIGGADVSVTHVADSTFTGNTRAIVYEGSNNLDPRLSNVNISDSKIGVDCRTGGSNLNAWAVGFSNVVECFVVNSGFQATIDVTSAELCRTVARFGGDDAGGYGGDTGASVTVSDARDCPVPFVINKAGYTSVRAHKAKGVVMIENRSTVQSTVMLAGAAAKLLRTIKPGSPVTVKTQ